MKKKLLLGVCSLLLVGCSKRGIDKLVDVDSAQDTAIKIGKMYGVDDKDILFAATTSHTGDNVNLYDVKENVRVIGSKDDDKLISISFPDMNEEKLDELLEELGFEEPLAYTRLKESKENLVFNQSAKIDNYILEFDKLDKQYKLKVLIP